MGSPAKPDAASLYLLSPMAKDRSGPAATSDLISLYGLKDLAASVARQDPVTGAKRKLRKSYKGHIVQLPGKHPVPGPGETPWGLLNLAQAPVDSISSALSIDDDILAPIRFERSTGGVPGFDSKLLTAPGAQSASDLYPQPLSTPSGAASPAGGAARGQQRKKRNASGTSSQEKRRKV